MSLFRLIGREYINVSVTVEPEKSGGGNNNSAALVFTVTVSELHILNKNNCRSSASVIHASIPHPYFYSAGHFFGASVGPADDTHATSRFIRKNAALGKVTSAKNAEYSLASYKFESLIQRNPQKIFQDSENSFPIRM